MCDIEQEYPDGLLRSFRSHSYNLAWVIRFVVVKADSNPTDTGHDCMLHCTCFLPTQMNSICLQLWRDGIDAHLFRSCLLSPIDAGGESLCVYSSIRGRKENADLRRRHKTKECVDCWFHPCLPRYLSRNKVTQVWNCSYIFAEEYSLPFLKARKAEIVSDMVSSSFIQGWAPLPTGCVCTSEK